MGEERRARESNQQARAVADDQGLPVDIHVHIPTTTIVKLLLTCLVVWALLRLWPEFVFVSISVLLAVAIHPVLVRLERRGITRAAGVSLLALLMVLLVIALFSFVMTALAEQASQLMRDFPAFRHRVEYRVPASYPIVRRIVSEIFALPYQPEVAAQLKRPLVWGRSVLEVGTATFFILILTLYLLLDGKRVYAWLLAYVPRRHREKMADTVDGVSDVVYAYVRGQVITSLLFAAFTAIVLHLFHVPAAMPLAVLAGLCDVIPVVGIVIATVPAALLALTVSPTAALAVLGLYVLYHIVESYYIVPRVYGQRMRLSTLAVLLALVAGSTLGGLIGAVLVLPLVAAYPIIERIWLAGYLNPEVIRDHKALAKSAETGSDQAVDAVLQGEKHPGEGPPSKPSVVRDVTGKD
jgi:predicted PurR-regulated permease PerM